MIRLEEIQKAIREEHLNGWLFCNIRHRDTIADRLLDIPTSAINSRQWFYFIPDRGNPIRITHAVEAVQLDHLPGKRYSYYSKQELIDILTSIPDGPIGVQFSKELTGISYLDYGTALLLQEAGFILRSSSSLIQKTVGVLQHEQIDSHTRASAHLYEIVDRTWDRVEKAARTEQRITEGEIQESIIEEFSKRGLITDHLPIVAAGINSSNPHYSAIGEGKELSKGDVLQLDLFAREDQPGSIFADISWIGIFDSSVPQKVQTAFSILKTARQNALSFIDEHLSAGKRVRGSDVDAYVRTFLSDHGYGEAIRHRTGHSIDTELHGSGVNLDSVEFPDHRCIIEGSCFSIEPGIYLSEFGLRTEIDVVICEGTPMVFGGTPQERLLVLSRKT